MHTLATLSLIAGASALTVPRSSCSFGLTASGGQSGTIGQLSDGQNRIGGGLSPATFTISNGGITDTIGRGCILTPSVEQLQCDEGVGPTYGFAIESNGNLTSNGSSVFYACPASDTEWNLYTTPVVGQNKCVEIALTASGCGAEASTSAVQSVATVTIYACSSSSTAPVPEEASTSPSSQEVTSSADITPAVPLSFPSTSLSSPEATSSTEITPTVPLSSPSTSETISEILPVANSSEEAATSTETTAAVGSTSSSEVKTFPTPIQASTTIPPIEKSSPAVSSATKASKSLISISSLSAPKMPTSLVGAVPSVQSETTTLASTTLITSVASTFTIYPTTAPYANTTASSTVPSATSLTSAAPTCVATELTGSNTSGNYQYPHLIIPISSISPNTASGTQYFGTISSNVSTIFNFDIPSSYSGKTCNLIFLLPLQSELETSSYTYSGSGEIDFEQLSSTASSATTYNNAPAVKKDLGEFDIMEGSSTLIESFECSAGETLTYELKAVGNTYLHYFQDWNPSPIGLFITSC